MHDSVQIRRGIALGGGISAAKRAINSNGVKTAWVVPLLYGVLNLYTISPCWFRFSRASDNALLAVYRHKRSSFLRSCAWHTTPACNEKPLAFTACE